MNDATTTLPADAPVRALVDRLVRFDGPPDQFLRELIMAQCRFAEVPAGAFIRLGDEHRVEVLASHPAIQPNDTPPVWLAQAVQVLREQPADQAGQTRLIGIGRGDGMYGQTASQHIILLPTAGTTSLDGVEAFVVPTGDPAAAKQCQQRLELSLALLTLYEMRRTLVQRDADLNGLATATKVLNAANAQTRFRAAALAFCNELASRFGAERVSLGFLEGKYVKLRAMSQTENINRKMTLVQQIEAAMEECLDQDVEVFTPAPPDAGFASRAHEQLAQREHTQAICSLPLRRDGEPVAVVTLEKAQDQAVVPGEIDFLRMACDLSGPRLLERHDADRWIGARLAASTRRGLSVALGPTHTWAKAAAVGLLAAVLALIFVEVPYRIDAPFTFEAVTRRAVPAPFDGFLSEVNVEPGDAVAAGATLGGLDTDEIRYELAELRAQLATHRKEADLARREGKAVDVQIAQAKADEVSARIDLLEHRLTRARLRSPVDGKVVEGDLKQRLGAPVQRGDVLFEVAPLTEQRAEMLVSDADITEIEEGMTGTLAAASAPGDPLRFVVEQIHPIAEVVEDRNAFRVKLKLEESRPWLRPGIEGVAKIDVDRRAAGWVWTRDARNWLRLKLWW